MTPAGAETAVVPAPAAVPEGPAVIGELAPPAMPVYEPPLEARADLPKTASDTFVIALAGARIAPRRGPAEGTADDARVGTVMDLRLLVTTAALSGALGLIPAGQAGLPAPGQEEPIFSAQSELVVLQVMVEDRHGRYVTDLNADAFSITEDGTPQTIAFFNRLDAPVTVGLLVDSSGSMRGVRDLVAAAAGTFAGSSNPEDEIFALTFGDDVRAVLARGRTVYQRWRGASARAV